MNNIIYKWLLDNDKSENTTTSSSIIESIVILSINGVQIEYNSLLNYCNNNNNDNEKVIKNTYNNYNNNNNNNYKYQSSSFYGLTINQFQILNNNIQSTLKPLFENNSNNNNINITINYNNIKSKFDCLITIISENNLRNLNNKLQPHQQQQQKNKTIPTNINNKRNSNHMEPLFFKLWRNKIIRNEILYHTRLYNIHLNKKFIIDSSRLMEYKYKSYIAHLDILESTEFISTETSEDLTLPYGLQHFGFSSDYDLFKLESLQHLSSLTSISLLGNFNQSLDGGWISNKINSLQFGHEFQQPINFGHLPKSLTSLILHAFYDGIIEYGAIPKSVTTLSHLVDSRDSSKIPTSTTILKYDDYFNKPINEGDIPQNVTSLEFGEFFRSEILPNTFPPSIRTIIFGLSYRFRIKEGTLPPNLTSLTLGYYYNQDGLLSVPSSITNVEFKNDHDYTVLREGLFLNTNLQSLKFSSVVNIHPNTLPTTLTHLDINQYDGNLSELVNVFPTSLKSLVFGFGDLDVGIPTNITSIQFGSDNITPVKVGSIFSSNIKTLEFNSKHHSLNLTDDGLLPQSLESIRLNCNNINLINSFDSSYFHDKIKLLNNKNDNEY